MAAQAVPAAPMAAPANLALTLEPYYSGTHDKTCTAERFLRAVESQRETNGWDDLRTIAQAKKFLTGPAEAYFLVTLKLVDPERFRRINTNWAEWQRAFRAKFFSVASAADVSTQWSRLQQNQGEDVFEFHVRVTQHLEAYSTYFPPAPVPIPGLAEIPAARIQRALDDFVDDVPVLAAVDGAHPGGLVDALGVLAGVMQDMWMEATTAGAIRGRDFTLEQNGEVLVRKVFIAGLADETFRRAARKMEIDGLTSDGIVNVLTARERGLRSHQLDNKPIPTVPRPSLARISEVSSAPRRGRSFGRSRGSTRDGRGRSARFSDRPPVDRSDPDKYTMGATCGYCGNLHHTEQQCRKRLYASGSSGQQWNAASAVQQQQPDSFAAPGNDHQA